MLFSSNKKVTQKLLLWSTSRKIGWILPALKEKSKIKNSPSLGLNPQPPDYQSHALPTVLARNLLGRRFLKWASCTTSHVGLCSFLESIEQDSMKVSMIDTANKIVTLHSCQSVGLEVVGSIPGRDNFLLVACRATYVLDGWFFAHFFWKVEGTVHIHVNFRVAHVWLPCRMVGGAFQTLENLESLENFKYL